MVIAKSVQTGVVFFKLVDNVGINDAKLFFSVSSHVSSWFDQIEAVDILPVQVEHIWEMFDAANKMVLLLRDFNFRLEGLDRVLEDKDLKSEFLRSDANRLGYLLSPAQRN